MKSLLKYLKPYYARMIIGFSIKTFGTLSELLIPLILTHILSNAMNFGYGDIVFWGVAMLVCSGVACISNVVANRMAARVSSRFAEALRKDLFIKTLKLSGNQTDRFTIPSLESRITTDTYHVHGFINMMQRMGVRAPILLLGGVIITMFMDFYLSLVMVALLPLIFVTIYFVRRKGIPLYTTVQQSVDNMIRVVREDSQGIRVIKALSKTDHERSRYDKVNKGLVMDETRAGLIMGTVNPLMTMFMNGGSIGVIGLGAYFASKGASNPETIIAFMQYFTQISMAMMAVTRMFVMYTKCSASARRIAQVIDENEDITVMSKADYPDKDDEYAIEFSDVSFSYNGKKDNLKDISFKIKKGDSLGIIGATGSGKTTVVNLLLRFYDPYKGGIYINGENIKTIEKERLYAMMGTARQQDFLYADTIEENIRFGRNIAFEDIVKAAETAQAHDFITGFADGYSHMLSPHGTNISGGQKQRILISRAIAARPPILIFDDSSSALDYRTDANLRVALKDNLPDTTVVTVAQRVSSVKDSSLIIVIDEGIVIGMGTHDYLMDNCPEYREISDSQMGGAFVD